MTASVPVIAFFNNKGGVGKTSLVYHVAHMAAGLGLRVVAADLDPQANLSAAFLEEERLEALWPAEGHPGTIFGCIQPLKRGIGDVRSPSMEAVEEDLFLLAGDMALSSYEDQLSETWPKCLDGDERSFRVTSSFWRVLQEAARLAGAAMVLIDLGPNLGAINRAALIAADHVAIPLAPDLFSLQGLRNLGPALRSWRKGWRERVERFSSPGEDLALPSGGMRPMGYVVMQHSVRLDRPVKAYQRWIERIPGEYRSSILDEQERPARIPSVSDDKHCLCLLKHYRSLMAMAQEARKPMFHLRPVDGALGSHTYAVRDAYADFKSLTLAIAGRAGAALPPEWASPGTR